MKRIENARTQPLKTMPVFNNWAVVAEGWYVAAEASRVPKTGHLRVRVCHRELDLYRDAEGRVCAVDPWEPGTIELTRWATRQKYGFVWVYPASATEWEVADLPGWEGAEVVSVAGIPYERPCHHHVCMINGIDPQHLRTVHGIHMDMGLEVVEGSGGRIVDYTLSGEFPSTTLRERLGRWLLGDRYQYSMRYADGTIGLLSVNQGTRLFGRGPRLPSAHMIFAYQPVEAGRTLVQPIYLARRRSGLLGWLWTRLLLLAMKWGFYVLRDEDGEIYEHIRFRPSNLLPMDAPISRYMAYINRLRPSVWSSRSAVERARPPATRSPWRASRT